MSGVLHILTITERIIPSNAIGVVRPMLLMQRNGEIEFRLRYSFRYKESDIQWADVVVMCRSIQPDYLRIIELIKKHGKKLIFDIDDNFFELSVSTKLGRYHRHPVHLYVLYEMLRNADAVRVYSRPMEETALQWNPNTFRLKSYFDFSLIEGVKPQQHDKIRIVYATSRGNADKLSQICTPAVARVLDRYPDRVEFYAFGKLPEQLKHYNNAHKLNYIKNYEKYIHFFAEKNFDIGLAPLLNDRFHNSKTNNKFREYGAMRVCGIYSRAQIYTDCVTDRVNGLLVDNTIESWYQAICELVENPSLMELIKDNAKQSVQSDYSMESTISDWRRVLKVEKREGECFQDLRRLSIVILIDGSFAYRNPRIDELTRLLGFCEIKFGIMDFWQSDLQKLRKYDLCVCFVPDSKNVSVWITALLGYAVKNIIVDTMSPFEETIKYPNVTFTNPAHGGGNCFAIPYVSDLEVVDINRAALETVVTDVGNREYFDVYETGIARIKQASEKVFSVHSPVFLWAELLSHYEGTYEEKNLTRVLRKYIGYPAWKLWQKVFRGIKKITAPVGHFVQRIFNRASYLSTAVYDYIKINRLKKY